jgi:hypothetical protein
MRFIIILAATLAATGLAVSAASAAGTAKFCLKGPGAEMNCTYETMATCDKAKKGTETCVANPTSTTGSATGTSPAKKY